MGGYDEGSGRGEGLGITIGVLFGVGLTFLVVLLPLVSMLFATMR